MMQSILKPTLNGDVGLANVGECGGETAGCCLTVIGVVELDMARFLRLNALKEVGPNIFVDHVAGWLS